MTIATRRLFFSVKFSTAQQQQLLGYQQQALTLCPHARAVDSSNLHLTLFFLGEVDEACKQRLIAATRHIQLPAFALTLTHLACFIKPKIIYLAPADIPPVLATLQQHIAALCKAEGFSDIHDSYRPHITLARHAVCTAGMPHPVAPVTLKVDEFALYLSAQQDGRLAYQPLHRFKLT